MTHVARIAPLLLILLSTTIADPAPGEPSTLNLTQVFSNLDHDVDRIVGVSPDGEWILFTGDLHDDDYPEVYSVPSAGGPVNRPYIAARFGQAEVGFSGDGLAWIRARPHDESQYSLFVWDYATDTTWLHVNAIFDTGVRTDVRFTPDGQRILYKQGLFEPRPLYSAPVDDPGSRVQIGPGDGEVHFWEITPDSQDVVYTYEEIAVNLLSEPVGGGNSSTLSNDAGYLDEAPEAVELLPDGETVLFRARDWDTNLPNFYAATVGDSFSAIDLTNTGPDDESPGEELWFDAPTERLVFRTVDGFQSVPIDGSEAPSALHQTFHSFDFGGDPSTEPRVVAGHLVFRARISIASDPWELFATPVDGSATTATRLGPPEHVDVERFELTVDGSRVLYEALPGPVSPEEESLFSVSTGGGTASKLNPRATDDTFLLYWTHDDLAIFTASGGLYSAPVDGRGSAELLASPAVFPELVPTPGADPLVFESGSPRELLRLTSDGSRPPTRLHDDHVVGEIRPFSDGGWMPLPDGGRVAYVGDVGFEGKFELFIGDDGRHRIDAPFPELQVLEGDDLLFPLRLDYGAVYPVTAWIDWTGGTAAPADVDSVDDSTVFAPGATGTTFLVDTADDSGPEVFETVELTVENFGGIPVDTPLVEATIVDPDGPTVEFQRPGYTVTEGSSITVVLEMSETYRDPVSVVVDRPARNGGTATASDFRTTPVLPATLVIPAQQLQTTLEVRATPDSVADDGETLVLEIVDGVLPGATETVTITILDGDPPEEPIFADGFESGDTGAWTTP